MNKIDRIVIMVNAWDDSLSIEQPSLNDLPPTVPFITQDQANQNEWNPKSNQNPGVASSTVTNPVINKKIKFTKNHPKNITKELENLVNLIEMKNIS